MFDFCEVPIWRSPCFGFTKYNTLSAKAGYFQNPLYKHFYNVFATCPYAGNANRARPIGSYRGMIQFTQEPGSIIDGEKYLKCPQAFALVF